MGKPSVLVEGVSKKFGLSLKSALKYGLMDSMRRMTGLAMHPDLRSGEFWALQDISFSVEPGDALGIMGVNGSGKTTLLRILNGTYSPDAGKVFLRGRIGALIAAGAGFSPMLSGRENIYISGTLLGMTPGEIKRKFDEIVDFAELNEFIDLPVRNYSSGMSVRLGFAIAVIGSPEILLVDEVLAVGDLSFQKKCFEKILALKNNGTTILLVSHAPGSIWAVCNKGILISSGRLLVQGPVEDVVRAYDDQNARSSASRNVAVISASGDVGESEGGIASDYGQSRCGTGDVVCTNFRVVDAGGSESVSEIEFRSAFQLEFDIRVMNPVDDLVVRVVGDSIHYRNVISLDSYEQECVLRRLDSGDYRVRIAVRDQNLRPGVYTFNIGVVRRSVGTHLFLWLKCGQLIVLNPTDRFLYAEPLALVHLDASFSFCSKGSDVA